MPHDENHGPKTPSLGQKRSRQNILNRENLSRLDSKGSEFLRKLDDENYTVTS